MKNKKAEMNIINKNNKKCFRYAVMKDLQRIMKTKPFINRYTGKE